MNDLKMLLVAAVMTGLMATGCTGQKRIEGTEVPTQPQTNDVTMPAQAMPETPPPPEAPAAPEPPPPVAVATPVPTEAPAPPPPAAEAPINLLAPSPSRTICCASEPSTSASASAKALADGVTREAPLAKTATVSLVEVSPLTEMRLKLRSIASSGRRGGRPEERRRRS